jgi:hypothetical protein
LQPALPDEPLGHGITAFAASEAMFVDTYLVVPARCTARAGFPHDLLETERGEAVPVTPPD